MIHKQTSFVPAPQGTSQGVLVDTVDLGLLDDNFGGVKPFVRYVFQTEDKMENGKPYVVMTRFNASLHERANLRKFLESMRGKAFTNDELREFDDETLIGTNVSLNIVHKESNGKVYANIASIAPWNPKYGPEIEPTDDYVRFKDRETSSFTTDDGGQF